jgi:hypothetical protein
MRRRLAQARAVVSQQTTESPNMKTFTSNRRVSFTISARSIPAAILAAAVLLLLVASARAADKAARITERLDSAKAELVWSYKGRPLLVYTFATNQFKPYVRELYTLRGENVLLDAPSDHLHHHGLMYAIRVNGVNFWEEKTDPGVEKPVKLLAHKAGVAKGIPQASFTQLIHWVAHTNRSVANSAAVALLIERRTLTLTVNEAQQEVAVEWISDFEAGPVADGVRLHGTEYNGLGFRPVRGFDKVAEFQDSLGAAFTTPQPRAMPAAEWTSMSARLEGQPVSVAMFGDPANARGNAVFFTMREPFAYLAAAQALNKEPISHAAGDKFRLRYLVTVNTELQTPAQLAQRCAAWLKNSN